MRSWSVLYAGVHWLDGTWLLLVLFMLLKVTEKVSLGCNARYNSIYRIYGYYYYLLFLLLFIVYTITVTVTILLLSPHLNILVIWTLIV